ncbi:MAG: ABC transporter ATP-binding protein [Lachnospiraceae bacterium]|nr:ABC transporter ATP-binding protein [Lachnospiraceae bacterium]
MAEVIFKAEQIVKKYKKKKSFIALNGVDMEIHRGDIYGFVGENGAGKTTLIRILAGWVTQTSGNIALFGESSEKGLCQKRRYINGMIEAPAFYPDLTAWDNLEICRLQRGITHQECIRKSLKIVGLTGADIDSTKTKKFSLGMKQRLGIAMALLGEPQLLYFDEPLNGLDPVGVRDFHKLIRAMSKNGITILISSHMLRELNSLATCYGFIHKGKMLEQISSEDLTEKFRQYMLLTVDDAASTVKILKEKLGLSRLEAVSDDTVHLYEGFDQGGEMMKALITNGIIVEEMTKKGEDLEKYYLSLIKKR